MTCPAGLNLATDFGKNYVDNDGDGLLESVTRTMTVNGKLTVFAHDIAGAT